jgi:glutathione peroxidase
MPGSIHDITVTTIEGDDVSLECYRGRVMLVVNVASRCGYTPQYAALEDLYRRYRDRGVVVLGFPCNQFGGQEPGTSADIKAFCSATYDVTFPMFAPINVNGAAAHPLYQMLKASRRGWMGLQGIKWNFTKFLVDREGKVVGRYGPRDVPASIEPDIIAALEAIPAASH